MNYEPEKIILDVDDDQYICEFLTTVLEKAGFRVATALNGELALKIVRSGKIDLILLDWMMPVLSGFEVLKELQKNEYRTIPVIVITATSTDKSVIGTIKHEMNVVDFMHKPLNHKILLARVREILKRNPNPRTKRPKNSG